MTCLNLGTTLESVVMFFGCMTRSYYFLFQVMYVAAIFPYILLTVLLVRGLTLDGHSEGIDFYVKPNITKLSEAQVCKSNK